MNAKRIGVIMGGSPAGRRPSCSAGEAIASALEAAGRDVVRVRLDPEGGHVEALRAARLDVAFLALQGRLGEDGCVQGMLELLQIPYTGSGVLGSALALDKLKAKELFRLHNLPTPPYYVVEREEADAALDDLHGSFGFPVVVKPRREGSSIGVTQAGSLAELREAVRGALRHDDSVLVERFVQAREVSVGILDGRVLGAIEVVAAGSSGPETFYPARLPAARYRGVLNLGEQAAACLETAGPVQVDLLVTEGQNEYVLEVNTSPDVAPSGQFSRMAAAAGYGFSELCEAILDGARLHTGAPRFRRVPTTVPRAPSAVAQVLPIAV